MAARIRFFALALALASAAVIALLTTPVQAGPLQTDLKVYFDKLRSLYPECEVTGRFYDFRSVSMYRAHAGMHLGYDLALNAGRQVPAGWPGRVVGIIPWTDTEYGVCVEVMGGYRVTYGHVYPLVHEGDAIQAGQFVGSVARDHVDIKVRDISGGYFDWGASYGVLDGSGPWSPGASTGLLPAPAWMGGGRAPVGVTSVDGLIESYRQLAGVAAMRKIERDRVRDLVDTLNSFTARESQGLPQAESQMLAWYRAADEKKVTEAQVEALSLTVKARRTRVTRLGYVVMGRQRDLREKEAAYQSARESADATREAALKAGASEDRLSSIAADARKAARAQAVTATNRELNQRVAAAETRYASAKSRYPGACSKTDLDEAEKTVARLKVVQGLWEQGCHTEANDLNW